MSQPLTSVVKTKQGISPGVSRTYHIRTLNGSQAVLAVPMAIARIVTPDTEFVCEMTDEGLLYRRVLAVDRPAWDE